MKKIVCEICGSANIVKQDGNFVCQDCGIKYSASEVKALMKETEEKPEDNGASSSPASLKKPEADASVPEAGAPEPRGLPAEPRVSLEPQAAAETGTSEPQSHSAEPRAPFEPQAAAEPRDAASSVRPAASGQPSAKDRVDFKVQMSNSDHSTSLSIYLHNAREARKTRSWHEAHSCYEHVKSAEPKNLEAVFYSAYCLVMEAFRTVPPGTVYRKADPIYSRSYYRLGRTRGVGFHRSERTGYVKESVPISQTPERCRMLDLLLEAVNELNCGFSVSSSDELQITVGRMSRDIIDLFEKHYKSRLVSKWRNTIAGAREYAPLEQRLNQIEIGFVSFLMKTAQVDLQSLYGKLAVRHCMRCLYDPHTPQQLREALRSSKEAALNYVRIYEPDWAPADDFPKYFENVVLPPEPSKSGNYKKRFQYGGCFTIAVFVLAVISLSRLLALSC